MDVQNSPLFDRLACFYIKISGNFECLQYFKFERDLQENKNLYNSLSNLY